MAKRASDVPAFTGFPRGGVDFFRALAVRQDRAWFQAHKADYQALWETPMRAFLAELQPRLVRWFPKAAKTEAKIFRIYRDTRFSKDKSPFKTSISAVIPLFPGGMMERVGFYLELGPAPFIAAGRWMMEGPTLKRFRRCVADERLGVPFAKAVARATKAGFEVSSQQQLVRVPKPWPADHPRGELLRHKGFALTFPAPTERELAARGFVQWAQARLAAVAPVLQWVEAAASGKVPRLG